MQDFLINKGYIFYSDTDTEVIAHLLHWEQNKTGEFLQKIIRRSILQLYGNYSMVVMDTKNALKLTVGLRKNEKFVASDQMSLLNITNQFVY